MEHIDGMEHIVGTEHKDGIEHKDGMEHKDVMKHKDVNNIRSPNPCQVYYNLGAELSDEDEPEEASGTSFAQEERFPPGEERRKEEIWNRGSVPPDLVASAERFRVIKEEPRKNISSLVQVVQVKGNTKNKLKEIEFLPQTQIFQLYIFTTLWCKPLLFQTETLLSNRIQTLKCQRSTDLGCKDTRIKKSILWQKFGSCIISLKLCKLSFVFDSTLLTDY